METETFTYDFLDRLTGVTGPYTESYAYNLIGNLTTKNGVSYTYSDANHKHAVTAVGATSYAYDSNGNMTTRGDQNITWDAENRVTAVSGGASFIYDGDGSRVKKTENGQTVLYINRYFEKNLTTSNATSSYYLGNRLVAQKTGGTLNYTHQDHLIGTSVASSETGTLVSSISYLPFGSTRSGDVPTDRKFTGQRLDGTGLYYYGARYYDPGIGRFISADTVVPVPSDPQTLNRYSYCLNNPLNSVDPSGHMPRSILNFLAREYISGAISNDRYLAMACILGNGLNIGTGIHELAQIHLARQLAVEGRGIAYLEYPIPSGRGTMEADVVTLQTQEVWEVKPEWGLQDPLQIQKYAQGAGFNIGRPFNPIEGIPLVGDINMRIEYGEGGWALYLFYRYGNNGQPVTVEVPEVYREIRETVGWSYLKGLGAAAGVGIAVCPTVWEDIATYGAGISNDWQTIQYALQWAMEYVGF